jgi:hypothetical protein
MKGQPTPGPWKYGAKGDDRILAGAPPLCIALVTGGIDDGIELHGPISEANARLIAAAPELLDALKAAVRTIRTWHGLGTTGGAEQLLWELYQASPEMKRINAAIAKAEGR